MKRSLIAASATLYLFSAMYCLAEDNLNCNNKWDEGARSWRWHIAGGDDRPWPWYCLETKGGGDTPWPLKTTSEWRYMKPFNIESRPALNSEAKK
jgi:hypothetical protein